MIYEYDCKYHGVFEVMQKMSDLPLESCPKCEEEGRLMRECNDCHATVSFPKESIINHCGSCNSTNLSEPVTPKPVKLISLSSFQLVGGGWARDLYSSK